MSNLGQVSSLPRLSCTYKHREIPQVILPRKAPIRYSRLSESTYCVLRFEPSRTPQQVPQELGEGRALSHTPPASRSAREDREEGGAGVQSIKLIASNGKLSGLLHPPVYALISPGPTVQEKNMRAGNCSAFCVQGPFFGKTSGTNRQSPKQKVSQLVAGSGLPPPTSTYPPPETSRETLVSPLAFNLAK